MKKQYSARFKARRSVLTYFGVYSSLWRQIRKKLRYEEQERHRLRQNRDWVIQLITDCTVFNPDDIAKMVDQEIENGHGIGHVFNRVSHAFEVAIPIKDQSPEQVAAAAEFIKQKDYELSRYGRTP